MKKGVGSSLLMGLIVFHALVFPANAKDSGLCEDLATYSCAPGLYDDGTGRVSKSDYQAEANKKLAERLPVIRQNILQTLHAPKNEYFFRLAVVALGLKDAPECASTQTADPQECRAHVAEGMTSLTLASLGAPSPSFAGDFEALEALKKMSTYDKIKDETLRLFRAGLPIEENEKKVREKMFPQVLELVIKKISSLPMDEKAKELMIMKLNSISFGGTDCSKVVPHFEEIFYPNAVHLPFKPVVSVCKGHLLDDSFSEFKMAKTLAHEIAHGIDPCQMGEGFEGLAIKYKEAKSLQKLDEQFPIKGLAACLRSEKSVGALNKLALESEKPKDTSFDFCTDDQMGEAFADWMGTEILVDYISKNFPTLTQTQWQKGFGNVYRRDCQPSENQGWGSEKKFTDVHPEKADSINKLLLVNPKVREKMGCTKPHSQYIYCDANHPDAMDHALGARQKPRGSSRTSPKTPPRGVK